MMVERTVLLHQNDDMLNIVNRACAVVGRNVERLGNARIHGGCCACGGDTHHPQESTPIVIAHRGIPFSKDREFRNNIVASNFYLKYTSNCLGGGRILLRQMDRRMTAI